MLKIPEIGITHSGVFHADEVFASAFLQLINPNIHIIRANDPVKGQRWAMKKFDVDDASRVVIYDVGGGEFDHHQKDTIEYRYPDTKALPYSSFGKIVRAYHAFLMSEEVYEKFDKEICIPIDYQDCKGRLIKGDKNELSHAISLFNPNWNENSSDKYRDACFDIVVMFARSIIERVIAKCNAMIVSESTVMRAIEQKNPFHRFIVLDTYVNYGSYITDKPDICWAIYPSSRGGYQVFSCGDRTYHNRDTFSPQEIEELEKMRECTFVHPGAFTAVFETLESAIAYMSSVSLRAPIPVLNNV